MLGSNPTSPANFGLTGTFSPDEIHELLGAMVAEHDHDDNDHHQQHDQHDQEGSGSGSAKAEDGDPASETNSNCNYNSQETSNSTNCDLIEEEAKAQARSERKRSREKQRRSDVNKQFSDLTSLIRQIEVEEAEEDHNVHRLAFSATNRVDLIARAITHLERLREGSKRRKLEISCLKQQLEQSKKAGEETAAKLKEVMFNQPSQSKQVRNTVCPLVLCSSFMICVCLVLNSLSFISYYRS